MERLKNATLKAGNMGDNIKIDLWKIRYEDELWMEPCHDHVHYL
jgi:hypothetical protein